MNLPKTIRSMTGFAWSDFEVSGYAIHLEIKTVNHRFCDINIRCPKMFSSMEQALGECIRKSIKRGRVDVYLTINYQQNDSRNSLNTQVAENVFEMLSNLGNHLGLLEKNQKPSLELVASFREIFQEAEANDPQTNWWELFEGPVQETLSRLVEMRETEGRSLKGDIESKLGLLEKFQGRLQNQAKDLQKAYFQKITERLESLFEELKQKPKFDENKILTEAGMLAERSDIQEEISRLESHLSQFRNFLNSSSPIGRKMDFLCQEIFREVNTVGSKCNDLEIAKEVIDAKSNLEAIREQVQNVE